VSITFEWLMSRVYVSERRAQPHRHVEAKVDGHGPGRRAHDAPQIDAVDQLHRDERLTLEDADVERAHDVRMIEQRRQPRLRQEHLDDGQLIAQVGQDALERDRLAVFMHAAPNLGHAAAAK
jgi:hypothetical protein